MAVNESTRDLLREMGLNPYEIDSYIVLLEGGRLTAMEVSREASVPYSKIYEVLNSLKEKGWIKSSMDRPFKYFPVPPVEAVAQTKRKLEERYQGYERLVSDTLQPLYEKRELVERPDILILHGQHAVLIKLAEILTKATREIMVAAPEFARGVLGSVELSINDLKKGVNVKVLVAGRKEDWAPLRNLSLISELRTRDHMFGGGTIVDGKEALLFLGEEKPTLVIWSNHGGLVGFAREYFQFLWDSSAKA
jgi:sugar-specific transcriptional regulator TrmB